VNPPLTPMARMRYDHIRRLLPAEARTALEIGCGEGGLGFRLAQHYRYVGIEPDETSCATARARIGPVGEVRCGDISAVAGECFDIVCAFEVLEHIEDDRAALTEWRAHLNPGGHLLLSVPAFASRFSVRDEAVGHYRRYEPADLRALLQDVGFTDIKVVLYGAPLGYLLEGVRNHLAKRGTPSGSREQKTAASGRFLQPSGALSAGVTVVGTAPFTLVQRAFPRHGVGIVASARRAD
jgi:SAM-dependent methyltransferase